MTDGATTADPDAAVFDHDPHDDELGTAVVRAVARANDVRPEEVQETLHDVVDPDGLDRLFAPKSDGSPRRGARVELALDGCRVVVERDGTVAVDP